MLKVFICDDDKDMLEHYSRLIFRVAKNNDLDVKISTYNNGEELVFNMLESKNLPDIIYLDVLMNEINGIETAKKLREMGCIAEIVFLTSSEDFVFESFDVKPMHYLLKEETSSEKFEETFLRAANIVKEKVGEKILVETGSEQIAIPLKSISYIEIFKRKVCIYYDKGKTVEYYSTMKILEKSLKEKDFIRVHRSYIVNLRHITRIQKEGVVLSDEKRIPVGITYYEKVKKAFKEYIFRTNTKILTRS